MASNVGAESIGSKLELAGSSSCAQVHQRSKRRGDRDLCSLYPTSPNATRLITLYKDHALAKQAPSPYGLLNQCGVTVVVGGCT